ncbi:MAG: UxaA family hydrolase [Candidatus Sumerlaeia bacterium]|nr:UxaA family hydrolase [Candidatus Sumerlaeia bacterium]
MRDYFYGYPRPDGQVGIRNYVLMLSGTLYANPTCERVAYMVQNTIPIVHPLGRCQIAPDLAQTKRTLVGHGLNPNAGAVIVVDHFKEQGCTADEIAHEIAKSGKPVEVVNIRREGGAVNALAHALRAAVEFQRKISGQQRERVPLSKLIYGINCGTSDVTSGLSANRCVGWVADRIVEAGGRALVAETTEMMGGEALIRAKAKTPEIAQKILDMIDRMEQSILACGVDVRGSQPTGDNIAGGLSTIEEKAIGAMQKWGTKTIVGAVGYAEPIGPEPGVWVMDTPGHGGESITGICAAGAQVMSFATGGGHTINHPLMITMRLTGNRESWKKMGDTMEVDVSDMFRGTPLDKAGERLFNEVLDICNGKMTKAEAMREFNGFAINRCGPSV